MATLEETRPDVHELEGDINKVVNEVKNAILQVDSSAGDGLHTSEVDLTLRAGLTEKGGVNAKFQLFGHPFGVGASAQKSEVQEISLKLTPSPRDEWAMDRGHLSDKLVDAITAIRASALAAAATTPKFDTSEATVELNVGFDKQGNVDFIGVGEGAITNSHTVKLTLAT